ncbi:MAG: ribonuclease H-like domain-containing protein [Aestuariivirga sp.]
MTIKLYRGDLPADFLPGASIAIDTETLGLKPARDKLCLVQISTGDGNAHLVQVDRATYQAPRLKAVLADTNITKIFHFARFDVAVLKHYLGVDVNNIYCTKIASRLVRTYTDRHGLKDLVRELLGIDLDKLQQSSDWGAHMLSEAQKKYAAQDVLYLHELKARLDQMLEREGRMDIAKACFGFLPTRAALDLMGWSEEDVFAHA